MNDIVTSLDQTIGDCQLQSFIEFCDRNTQSAFIGYTAFEMFAKTQFRTFWSLFLDWSGIIYEGKHHPACVGDDCETATFFPALRLNYAENLLHHPGTLIGCHADGHDEVTPSQLRERVIRLARFLQQLGVVPGDRVAAIARNNIEVIIAALASTAIGAIFSSCAHDMGTVTVLSRLQRLEPKVLFANCASQPWDVGKPLAERNRDIVVALPSLIAFISLDEPIDLDVPVHGFANVVSEGATDFVWQRFPFNHPLFILFSSGTTGAPKCIVHGTGGTLIEHVKEHRLHGDLSHHDRMFFQTSAGWMMWNWQLSALACGADVVVYDGPLQGPETLWQIVAEQRVTVFGTNPAYLQFTETANYAPRHLNLSLLRSILSTGSILYPRQFDWIVEHVKQLPVQSISGGTDILGCFVLGNPLLPVYRGQAQCRSLGLDVQSLPADTVGELICANPFPSRPTGFYGEPTNARYHEAYFVQNAGVWTHGDLIEFTPHGAIIHGRSDGVLNIRGVRIGPAEIYRILQQIPMIVEAMAVEQTVEAEPGGARLILLVVLRAGVTLDTALIFRIRRLLAEQGHAMMVPAAIIPMRELPVTHSGKRSETAARDAVNGRTVRNRQALLNPECLDDLAAKAPHDVTVELTTLRVANDLEQQLCDICYRHLRVPIKPTDNYLTAGGDSLVILSFLMEVITRTQTPLSLQTLTQVSSITKLAHLLAGEKTHGDPDALQIRPINHDDEAQVCRLLDEGFQRALPWQRIFNHPWQPEMLPRGFVLTADDVIVGFVGLIGATRNLNGKIGLVGNLTSWYVRSAYRGWSTALLAAAIQFEDVTFTSFTPGMTAQRVLRAIGFSTFGRNLFLPPLFHFGTLRGQKPTLIFDPTIIRQRLGAQPILDDHAGFECAPLLVVDGEQTALIMIHRRVYRRRIPYSEIIYCSTPSVLDRHLERIKLAVMRHQRTIGLVIGKQLLQRGIALPSDPLFRSSQFTAQELDKLYSELALLPV